jgi:hypothetical protein
MYLVRNRSYCTDNVVKIIFKGDEVMRFFYARDGDANTRVLPLSQKDRKLRVLPVRELTDIMAVS